MGENVHMEPIKEYYIAYFDLLGYKDFFAKNPDKVEGFLVAIYDAIEKTKNYIQEVHLSLIAGGVGQMSIRTKVFSDNILLCLERGCSPIEYPRLLAFLCIVADIQRNYILQYGLFLRGGITIGTLSFNNDFVFGQGLIDVVNLEEMAEYPRIIIGSAVLDYIHQPHFIKSEDLERACKIEKRAHAGEHISDEEIAFCNSIYPNYRMESFYLQWSNSLVLEVFDGAIVLNYLYYFDINTVLNQTAKEQMLDFLKTISPDDYRRVENLHPNQKQQLMQHKDRVIQKIKEFGKYDDLDVSKVKEAKIREHVLKKYLWVLSFHNYVCILYNQPECMIQSGSTCDVRFMRMTAEILDGPSSKVKCPYCPKNKTAENSQSGTV